MVKLTAVRAANAKLVQSQPLVAVFFGGTTGIGAFTAQALARAQSKGGKGLRVYIVGRSPRPAEETIAECRRLCPSGDFRFVQARDIALLKDVDRICDEIIKSENEKPLSGPARVDILVTTHSILSWDPRQGVYIWNNTFFQSCAPNWN